MLKVLVKDVMNRNLLYIAEGQRLDLAKNPILEFGVTAVPVLSEEHKPVGIVSLRDLLSGAPARATAPAWSILETETIEAAARVMGEASLHHLVVVDASGVAVGMVSALDLLRAFTGVASKHPEAFARFEGTHPRA